MFNFGPVNGTYIGSLKESKKQGPGILYTREDVTFGKWRNGNFEGSSGGRIKRDGTEYYGQLDSLMRPHGHGFYKYPNGTITIGNWEHGNREGFCQTIYQNPKSTYKGNYKNDLRHGQGVIESDTVTFSAEFVNDAVSGNVLIKYQNGSVYEGGYRTRFGRNGMGKLTTPNGKIYTGNFINDKLNGDFIVTSEFETFECNYQNNKRQGFATFNVLDNITVRVEYDQGNLVRNCFCKWFNGNIFRGKFHGYDYFGKMTFQNGKTIYGRLNTNWQFCPDYITSGISNKRNIDELSEENMGTKKVRFE